MEHRDRMIEKFTHDPDVRVFLMSLKAGGVVLNLTAASHVMLMDPWCATLSVSSIHSHLVKPWRHFLCCHFCWFCESCILL